MLHINEGYQPNHNHVQNSTYRAGVEQQKPLRLQSSNQHSPWRLWKRGGGGFMHRPTDQLHGIFEALLLLPCFLCSVSLLGPIAESRCMKFPGCELSGSICSGMRANAVALLKRGRGVELRLGCGSTMLGSPKCRMMNVNVSSPAGA